MKPWYLTLTDDIDNTENVLPLCEYIIALSLTIQKLWPRLKFFADKQAGKIWRHIQVESICKW